MDNNVIDVLQKTYVNLLRSRDRMLAGLALVQESEFQRELMVDSLINGFMSHLQDVAAHESVYASRFAGNGEVFGGYAELVAGNLIGRVSAISEGLKART